MKKFGRLILYPIVLFLLMNMYSCKKDIQTPVLPEVTTMAVSNSSLTTAESGGIIISDGGSGIIASGVCWSTEINPTIEDHQTDDVLMNSSFISHITGLTPYSTYYIRAYATNSVGTGYGNSIPVLKPDSIYAGLYDLSFIYYEFLSPITLNPIMESNMWAAVATETINLQFENDSMSLLVYMKIINPDSLQVIKDSGIFTWAGLKINSHDSASFHIGDRKYYVGQGYYTTFPFVSAFSENDLIRNHSKWTNFNHATNYNYWHSMWSYPVNMPGSIPDYDGGSWYIQGPQFRYIGFKYKGRLGWIKIDISQVENPKFISYAIKK